MRIGIDLGGTKIEGIVLNDVGEVLVTHRVPSPSTYEDCRDALRSLCEHLEKQTGSHDLPVGLGTPGAISPRTGLMKNANSTHLNGRPFLADVMADLAPRPVVMANDANCFALSEATDGAAAGHGVVFGVILGTGVGGGVVINGRALTGPQAIAGEWGHNPLPWSQPDEHPGPACWCGRRGCLEAWLSGPAVQATLGLPPEHLAETPEALARYCDRLARGLAHVVNILDPDVIVLGGGLSNIDALYAPTQVALARYVFSDGCQTPIVRHRHGDSSGVRGAAWLTRPIP